MKQLRLKKNGKAPLIAGAFDGESEDLIQKWIKEGGNTGVLTGTKSGIIVIDLDRHGDSDGVDSLKNLLEAYDIELPITKVVKTPNNGYHYYFKLPSKYYDIQLKQNINGYEGIDFQSSGRFVVAPPSQIDGRIYEVIRDVAELPELPEKLLEILVDKTITKKNKKRDKKWTGQLMESILNGAGEGSRNIFLASTIGKLFATGMEHDAVKVWSLYVNQISLNPPLPEEEVLRTYESVRKREIRRMADD
ncbi:DNA replication protein [Enterococcus phage vB_EfaS-DELF1]|uniref:DNA replication protein n=1 Tax=Enterococcus phage vB_EfaS-DELF1 TaxID=2683673 RepID=A0A5S9MM21_9CAUD|nr:DNA replication protein [Enterococcus phage vB_EfaS-DELF1]